MRNSKNRTRAWLVKQSKNRFYKNRKYGFTSEVNKQYRTSLNSFQLNQVARRGGANNDYCVPTKELLKRAA